MLASVSGFEIWWGARSHVRLEAALKVLISRPESAYAPALGRRYATSFLKDENPIFEEGNWINGGACNNAARCSGANGSNIIAASGHAFGTQSGAHPPPYDDSVALLTGAWGSDQFAQLTVWWNEAQGTSLDYDEVEIQLRGTLGKHFGRGYEINCRVGKPSANSYIQIHRGNGPPDDFTPPLAELKGTGAACQNGDIITATVVGNVITAYINGKRVAQARILI
jgi:hypothetical protein